MKLPRQALIAAASALAVGVAAYALGASAQTAPPERIAGYAVYAHSQYVLLQRNDGTLRSCSRARDTLLRDPVWECRNEGALPR